MPWVGEKNEDYKDLLNRVEFPRNTSMVPGLANPFPNEVARSEALSAEIIRVRVPAAISRDNLN
jgi:hypothetical protein